jgi:hypothetical protein
MPETHLERLRCKSVQGLHHAVLQMQQQGQGQDALLANWRPLSPGDASAPVLSDDAGRQRGQ